MKICVLFVQAKAMKTMTQACHVVNNRDIKPFVPALISAMARPMEIPDCVHKLAATTFVQVRCAVPVCS